MATRRTTSYPVRGGFMAALAMGALMAAPAGQAAFLEAATQDDNVSVGDSVTVDVRANPDANTTISEFDIDLRFDSNTFTATDVTFGGNLGKSSRSSSTGNGAVNAVEASELASGDLEAIQPTFLFPLFTVTFDAVAPTPNSTALTLGVNDLIDTDGNEITVAERSPAVVNVDGKVDVPAPAPLALLAAGVAGLLVRRRGRSA